MRRVLVGSGFLLGCVLTAQADLAPPPAPIGRWITADQTAVIQISTCGPNLCGQIVGIALAHPGDPMPHDWRGDPECGFTILEAKPTSGQWVGELQDPRNGSIYQAHIALDQDRHLVLHGYIGLPIFGQTQTWTPYSGRTMADCHLSESALAAAG